MLICMQKITFMTHFIRKILQRNSKLVILGTLGIPGHTHLKRQYQFEETLDVYLQVKNQIPPLRFSEDIAKICKPIILGTLDIPGFVHPK